MLARLIDFLLCRFASFITGVRPQASIVEQSSAGHRVYFANHNSHGDFILLWISLPYEVRKQTRPVAGKDYWTKGAIRRFLAYKVFNMLLIERNSQDPKAAIRQMSEALVNDSLIIFPEGTRKMDDDLPLQPFKSGLFYLAKENPDCEFVPVWISNMNNVLPKGFILPIPLLCDLYMGESLKIENGETKEAFLTRAQSALLSLNVSEKGKS